MKKFDYSIIIPTYNNLIFTKNCINSVYEMTDLSKSEVLIIDNGSTDGTLSYLLDFQRDHYNFNFLSLTDAIGGGNAFNMGFKIARGEYLIALNNDTKILGSNWVSILREPFNKLDKVAITGPVKSYSHETKAPFIILFCAMIPKKVLLDVGLMMDMGPGYGEDIDWCRRAIDKGYEVVQVMDCTTDGTQMVGGFPIYHAGEATVHGISDWHKITERNREILKNKWNK